ncbi:hypothetical protein B0H21DRAFT_767358 [Amylocystis lapponica]|nr:hypothetical protein B0H21DRAFT_767358 [Amylocystis lapponica]
MIVSAVMSLSFVAHAYREVFLLHFSVYFGRHYSENMEDCSVEWETTHGVLAKQSETMYVLSGIFMGTSIALLQVPYISTSRIVSVVGTLTAVEALITLVFNFLYRHLIVGTSRICHTKWCKVVVHSPLENPAVFLAAHAGAWLAWTILSLLACILAYVWEVPTMSGDTAAPSKPISPVSVCWAITSILLFGAGQILVAVSILLKRNRKRGPAALLGCPINMAERGTFSLREVFGDRTADDIDYDRNPWADV